jgi:hypothetical protein
MENGHDEMLNVRNLHSSGSMKAESVSTGGQMGQGWRKADKTQVSMEKGMLNITE